LIKGIPTELAEALSDRYVIERELGRGGMAVVYLAQDPRHHRRVAIKVLHPQLAQSVGPERFLHEIETIAQLQHPHILPLHDSGEGGGFLYFVMPYVAGESLRNRLVRERQLPVDQALEITRQVASALAYAHSHGVVHRDIKPENILLTDDQAIVADFGIGWTADQSDGERLTETGLTLGTPAYMSPEQAAGERHLDGRSDIYSLACTVYEMLAGEPPFTGPTAQAVIARRFGGPPPRLHVIREGVPAAVERAIDHALAKAPADRFSTALQFSAALLSAPADAFSPRASGPRVKRERGRGGRRLLILGLTGVGLAAAAAVGALLLREPQPLSLDANLIAVAPFDVFDPKLGLWREGLVDVLSRGFEGAGMLRSVSPRVAIRRWNGRGEPAEAKALGRRTGAQLVVFGQLVESGPDSVRLTATLLDVEGNRPLGEVDLRDASAHMDRLADSTTVAFLRALGRHRPIGSIRQAAFGGTSLPALKEFLRGEQFYRRSAWDSALAHYEAATTLDSTFALAYRRMQLSLTWSPPTAHSYQSPQAYVFRAAAFNRGLPARDSLLIMMDSLGWAMGWDDTAYFAHRRRAFAALDQVARLNPSDPEVWYVIGESRHHNGTPAEFTEEEILAAFDRAIQLDPGYGPAYEHTVLFAIKLGRVDLARQYAEAYLDFVPADISSQQNRLDALLLDPALAASSQTARLIDTSAAGPLLQAVFDLSGWADSAETALRLARSLASGTHSLAGAPSWLTDTLRKEILAGLLAFRGHFHEARATLRSSPETKFTSEPILDLALLGAFPPDSFRIMVRPLVAGKSLWPPSAIRNALSWWYADRDTAALKRFEIQAVAGARKYPNPVAKAYLRNLAEVARAYLVLAKGDSTEGLRMLAALPDSLCALGNWFGNCFFEKFTLAELMAARGQDREAAAIYDRWLRARSGSPLFVLGRLNRARIAERLKDRELAAELYQYVADTWRHADPELRPHVAAAKDALERLAAEPRE
jgi:eukaryotic-like serine/threonine-protein kinase